MFYTKSAQDVLSELDSSEHGLSATEVRERLNQYGPNEIRVKGEPLWRKLIEPFRNIFMAVLFIAVVTSFWHHAYVDGVIVLVIMMASAIIYYVQRFSTERILRALQKHNSIKIEVLRDGKSVMLDSTQLVPGDIILLNEGEKIPADARLVNQANLRVDESQLTGESLPIEKQVDPLGPGKEVYEQSNMVFQGSFIVGGEAMAVVVATGNSTQFGQLASLSSEVSENSPVQAKIDKLISQIIYVILGIAIVAFGLSLYRGMDILEAVRFIIALSVSAVPESLPVAVSVVLVLGMRRMAEKKALVRSMSAIETVGTITTIATDKTGTLTKNKLSVLEVWQPHELTKKLPDLHEAVALCTNIRSEKVHDPLDTAFLEYAKADKSLKDIFKSKPNSTYPFSQEVSMSGNLWVRSGKTRLALKGAPEQVLARSALSASIKEEALKALHEMTSNGLRVIALAHLDNPPKIKQLADLPSSKKLVFDGFVAVADVLRPEAKGAIETALKAGITVRMITGDHLETAFHIGRSLGILNSRDQVFDSRKMHGMSDEELEEIVEHTRVFSRVIPEHKHRLLAILKKKNITAMTGDGVNDVPALTNAHVGVAMGSGASIAKDAGDIILVDDNFRSIVEAVHEGRTIYANIKRMVAYLLATNAGEVIVSVASLIMGLPIPLLPVQILWVNLVTDTSMVIPLGLEPGERRNMNRPPQAPTAPLLSVFMRTRIVLIAIIMAAITLILYIYFNRHYGYEYARTIAFYALVVMQWASAFCARSDYEAIYTRIRRFNKAFYIGLSIAVIMQLLAIFGPLKRFLHITPVHGRHVWMAGLIAFFVPIILIELHKFIGRRFFNKGSHQQTPPTSFKKLIREVSA